jgi:penicillin-binding protein 1A
MTKLQPSRTADSQTSGSTAPTTGGVQKRSLYQQWWAWSIVGIGFGLGGAVLAAQVALTAIRKDLPNTTDTLKYVRTGTLTIKSADGTILQQTGPATRDKIALDTMPEQLPQAFLASEDQEFYQHDGVDPRHVC